MKAINLDTYILSLLTAKEDILNPRSSTNWALFAYDGITNRLKLADSGAGGVCELAGKFHASRPLYGLCRVSAEGAAQPRVIMIVWMGERVDEHRRAECTTHMPAVKAFFKEVHVFLSARTLEEVTEKRLRTVACKAVSVAERERVRWVCRPEEREETVGTNYKRTIAAAEFRRVSRDSFWAHSEREEEERKEEEHRRAVEDRRRRERERVQQERREAEERERRMNEKEQMIKEQRRLQAQIEAEARRQMKLKWAQQQKEHEEEMRACLRRTHSEDQAAEAAVLVSQRSVDPREFFRNISSYSSSQPPPTPGSPHTVKSPFRRYHRSLTDNAFIFNKSGSSTPTSPRSPTVLSPFCQTPPSPCSPTMVSPSSQTPNSVSPLANTAPETPPFSLPQPPSPVSPPLGTSRLPERPTLTLPQSPTYPLPQTLPSPSGVMSLVALLPETSTLSSPLVPLPTSRLLPALPEGPQMLGDTETETDLTAQVSLIPAVEEREEGVREEKEREEDGGEGRDEQVEAQREVEQREEKREEEGRKIVERLDKERTEGEQTKVLKEEGEIEEGEGAGETKEEEKAKDDEEAEEGMEVRMVEERGDEKRREKEEIKEQEEKDEMMEDAEDPAAEADPSLLSPSVEASTEGSACTPCPSLPSLEPSSTSLEPPATAPAVNEATPALTFSNPGPENSAIAPDADERTYDSTPTMHYNHEPPSDDPAADESVSTLASSNPRPDVQVILFVKEELISDLITSDRHISGTPSAENESESALALDSIVTSPTIEERPAALVPSGLGSESLATSPVLEETASIPDTSTQPRLESHHEMSPQVENIEEMKDVGEEEAEEGEEEEEEEKSVERVNSELEAPPTTEALAVIGRVEEYEELEAISNPPEERELTASHTEAQPDPALTPCTVNDAGIQGDSERQAPLVEDGKLLVRAGSDLIKPWTSHGGATAAKMATGGSF